MPEWPTVAEGLASRLDLVFWRGLFDIHLDPLAFIDANHRIVRANLALAGALGCRPEDLVGRPCFDALHGAGCPVEGCPHTRLLRDGCAHAGELELSRLGGCFWISVTPVFDDSGLLIGCLHIARNVTAYKTLEAQLRAARDEVEARAEARARELKEHLAFESLLVSLALSLQSPVSEAELRAPVQRAVAEIGATGGFGQCVFWRVTGDRAVALAAYHEPLHLLPPAPEEVSREQDEALFAALCDDGVVEATEGDVERCVVGIEPLWEGGAGYALLAARRVSRCDTRLALSRERLRLLCQVMGDAFRRQASAREAQHLREELSRLDQLSRLGQLSAALAHELNQPLAATLCNAQAAARLLELSPPDVEEVRSALDDIMDSARRAGDVMRHTRALFKGEQQARQPVEPRFLIETVLRLLRDDVALAGAQVTLSLGAPVPPVMGDVVQLQQVLINLVRNALDAVRGQPEARRTITLGYSLTDTGYVALTVADTGKGLPEGGEESIFVPLQSRKAEGLGMGLPICRQIVSQHGGTVAAMRLPEGGTCLTVCLPCVS